MKKTNVLLNRCTKNCLAAWLCISSLAGPQTGFAQAKKNAPTATANDSTIVLLPVAFGQQTKAQLIQSYDIVKGSSFQNTPVNTVQAALYGRLLGLQLRQSSGIPGFDAPAATLRGQSPMVVVDGVPRDLSQTDLYQVESVAVLKDALATAMYGMRGANGVLFIKTKQGTPSGNGRVSFTARTGIHQVLTKPRFLDAASYATLYNEALVNEGKQPIYSNADIDLYKNGTDPYGHPNVDWYNKILNDQSSSQQYNLNLSGGNATARYFVDLDYMNQGGLFATDNSVNTYPTDNYYKRYNFRTNVDVNLSASTSASVNVFGRIQNGNEPGAGTSTILTNLRNTPNNAYPIFNPNGTLGGNSQYQNNLYGQVINSGYRPTYDRTLGVDLSLKQEITPIKGLYAKALVSFNSYYAEATNRSKSIEVYSLALAPTTGDTIYTKFGSKGTQANSLAVSSKNRQIYSEFALGYDAGNATNRFHADLLFNNDNIVSNYNLPLNNYGVVARAKYSLADKYLIEATASYAGMNRYQPGNKWGFFPAIGLGWDMAKENWLQLPWLQSFKWRSSYGLTGDNSGAGYYAYQQFFSTSSSYYLRNPSTTQATVIEQTMANPGITWEKARKFNIGADLALFNNHLLFTAEYYNNLYYDLLQTRGNNNSAVLGVTAPQENIGEQRYSGAEFALTYQAKTNQLNWHVTANLALAQSKIVDMDEASWPYDYLKRTGQRVGQLFGLIADGFYQNVAEITNGPAVEGYDPKPGDIRYKDLNNDNIINVLDETVIGSTKPRIIYGVTAGLNWKGLDFSMLWQGTGNQTELMNSSSLLGFQAVGDAFGQGFDYNLERWTAATVASATLPRQSLGYNSNNHRNSSFWIQNTGYLRLKYAELGYALPEAWIKKIKLKQTRLFVNGLNLLTVSGLTNQDPEFNSVGYPNQRIINFGINIQF